ncbi:acyl-CoA dehydrogenase C-terminal domain-containing protein [Ferrimonas sp. SCSIO 43195]|uniref:acyl-CoA dehydrogenase C-terminal domain-containing protein n=1 Tax=Ferrimonas sp. SCSIO 43195 TaxID=2822844 RepID=UPI002075C2ED|nr:acyl-CoA dehydrogenase C-terminal domain-containing protein [Ferrimonas sp. SCSIO 43195]USD35722.1 acyl-CoA dehydrogenase C-terminal domain-containing protein [Ferrimonas sp. SCSIO 43195]
MQYNAPLTEMQFLLKDVFRASEVWQSVPALAEAIDMDTAAAILEEGAKITQTLIAPLNRSGDEEGVRFDQGQVITPQGYKQAYTTYAESGWVGLSGDPEYGGMGMPKMLGVLFDEMVYSASNAFALYGSLTAGAALCIAAHGSEELKQTYLPKLYSGEWSGAMDMTEPQSGSDLSQLRTKAVAQEDGSYRLTGSKIFITGGDHDLTDNVVHLVLAKLPDAPGGSRGISLFLVPKNRVNDDGSVGDNNGVTCGAVEHKMGIKASATCVINFDDAQGYLVGKVNRGLVAMFTMMNYERLSIGIQGLGCSEAAYQLAANYAKERKQGKGSGRGLGGEADPIVVHGDVRRMLLEIAAMTEAGRALSVYTGMQLDLAKHGDGEVQKRAADQVAMLTPLVKAFFTDKGLESTVHAQQVFGGHGYIREWGVEQLVRDVRIAQIYEGTNGIQALTLVGRKVVADRGAGLLALKQQIEQELSELGAAWQPQLQQLLALFDALLEKAQELANSSTKADAINSAATDYLHACGHAIYGWMWLKMVSAAEQGDYEPAFVERKAMLARYFFERQLPKAHYHLQIINQDPSAIMSMPNEWF